MNRHKKERMWLTMARVTAVLIIAFVVSVGAGVYWLFVIFPTMDECEMAVHHTIRSPAGKLSAVIFETECGATVGFNTHVSIAPADATFSRKSHPSFLALSGQHDLAIRWVGENVIEIALPKDETIYRNDRIVGDVTVEYR